MHQWSIRDAALERGKELRADAARARLVAKLRRSQPTRRRVSGRVRVARALRALGYLLLDAGHSLEPDSWRPV
jgi:hypothetical protein